MKPQIVVEPDYGRHNKDLDATVVRLRDEAQYKDLSCVVVLPGYGVLPIKVFSALRNMYSMPNSKNTWMYPVNMEVGAAYSQAVETIQQQLPDWKYMLCVEHDNVPPPDGMVRILKQMDAHPEFAAIGGLYFTKGEGGQPQIWGDPKDPMLNFRPQLPDPAGGLVECCGTGMGFTAFRMSMFKDTRLRKPWFVTGDGTNAQGVWTQDLYFWTDARKHGYRCAIDCSIKVGHYDAQNDFTW
jgi:hypothetical protein